MTLKPILMISAFAIVGAANAVTVAKWTFETSAPTTAGPISPEVGAGAASGVHAGASTYSSPAGNGSAKSFSSTAWAVGDAYQFKFSTAGLKSVVFGFDQASSNTGPGQFKIAYSTNGTSFTDFANYTVSANASPNPVWNSSTSSSIYSRSFDLSSITAINNTATVYIRLIDRSTVSANGGTVAGTGTDRVDNVTVTAQAVPEPTTMAVLGLGAAAMLRRRRKA